MSRASENVKRWRKRTKARMVAAFGDKCCICRKKYLPEIYDFHHINPKEKEFGFSNVRASSISWDKIVKELRKCVLICSNCHRLVEHCGVEIPQNVRRFDESYTTYKQTNILNKYAGHSCPICNSDEVLRGNTYCSAKCAQIARRVVKDRPSKEEVLKLVSENGWEATGRMFGVTGNAIKRWVRRRQKKYSTVP